MFGLLEDGCKEEGTPDNIGLENHAKEFVWHFMDKSE